MLKNLPKLNLKENACNSPHVVILGAGASYAAFPNGDKNNIKLPLMNNLIKILDLNSLFEKYDFIHTDENFENIYDKLSKANKHPDLIKEIDLRVENYFKKMELPDEVNIYDYLLLSLRSKDIIATFNWDPFLAQAFQRNKNIIGYENMPNIVFLHGNVSIGVCYECKRKGWKYNTCDNCSKRFSSSKLLYPVSDKNYSKDTFLSAEWKQLQNILEDAYFVTIFGYSAPITDVEAKELLLNVWTQNKILDLAQIEIIDIQNREGLTETWKDFIVRDNYGIYKSFFDTQMAYYPRRSCDAYAMATLQQNPWRENPLPKNCTLQELQKWILLLVEEEKLGKLSGNNL